MKNLSILNLLVIALALSACSKDPGTVLVKVKKLYNSGKYDKVPEYYTSGTIKSIEKLEAISNNPRNMILNISKKFPKDSSWEIVSEKIKGDRATVKIKYTEHPVENMKGLEIKFKMRLEAGKWKIDEEKEILESVRLLKESEKRENMKYELRNH